MTRWRGAITCPDTYLFAAVRANKSPKPAANGTIEKRRLYLIQAGDGDTKQNFFE